MTEKEKEEIREDKNYIKELEKMNMQKNMGGKVMR
jgi:hypothetical protein